MHFGRIIFCMMMLCAVGPLSGMNTFEIERCSADRSSSPLIRELDWHERSWEAKRVLKETDEFMHELEQNVKLTRSEGSIDYKIEDLSGDATPSGSEWSSGSESNTPDTHRIMMKDLDDYTLRDVSGTLSFLDAVHNTAEQSLEVTERIKTNVDHIDRTSANILRNFTQCCKCMGSGLISITGGVLGSCLLTAGSIRAAREDHVDEVAALILASGTVITVPSYYFYYKYFMACDNPRPVQTHNV